MSLSAAEVRAAFVDVVGDPPHDIVRPAALAPVLLAPLEDDAATVRARGLVSFCKAYSAPDRMTGKLTRLHPPLAVTQAALRTFVSTYEYATAFANDWPRYRAPLFHDAETLALLKEWGTDFYITKNPAAIAAIIQVPGALADAHCRALFDDLLKSQMGFDATKRDVLIETHRKSGPRAALHLFTRMKATRKRGGMSRPLCMGATTYEARDWHRIQKRRARET